MNIILIRVVKNNTLQIHVILCQTHVILYITHVILCYIMSNSCYIMLYYIGKTDRCLYTRTKEHAYHTESVIHQHLSTCEQFQHIKALLELYPDDDAMSNPTSIMAEHVLHNTKVIDKSNHWSLLLYQESLAIQRYKPELNHGIKASKELIIFN